MKKEKNMCLKEKVSINVKNNSKGITLVALIVTIIVLVILSGATIATLYGDSGILSEANNAKTKYENSSAEEEIRATIVKSFGNNGEIDISKLNNNLSKLGIDANIESLPTGNINYKGSLFIVKKDGSVSAFNAEEWDKTAADEDCFIWASDVEGEEGYNTIIGYTEKIEIYTKLRYPSRCTKIEFNGSLNYNGINAIKSRSFTNNILKVELPQTVTSIGQEAFGATSFPGFQSMEEIIIPDSVTYIGQRAFYSCVKLNNVKIPESVTIINASTFSGCTNLENIILPDSINKIGKQSFYGTALVNNHEDGLVYIGNILYTYKGTMPESTEIQIKQGTRLIADNCFENNQYEDGFNDCTNLIKVTIPNTVTTIGEKAFASCNNITSIIIPRSVTKIGAYAFGEWHPGQTVNFIVESELDSWEDKWDYYSYTTQQRVTNIKFGYKDFKEWDKIAADEDCFIWESNVEGEEGYGTVIGYTEKVNNYTKLRYPSRCTKIEFSASLNEQEHGVANAITSRSFTNNILKVELPETVTYIGDNAFGYGIGQSFQKMNTIILPDSLITIGHSAFINCKNLTSIIIPDSVTTIKDYAFSGWEANQTIYCKVSEKPSGWATTWDYYSQTETTRKAQLVWGYTGE